MSTKKFYRGECDPKLTTAPNGARVNADYLNMMTGGPWDEIKTWRVNERCFCITGICISNHTFIEGETGLILIDPGILSGDGLEALRRVTEFSNKPISALIYSHHHYTGAAQAILDAFPDRDIPIYGHPNIVKNMSELVSGFGPAAQRRAAAMRGEFLPEQGADAAAVYRFFAPLYNDPALCKNAHVEVTHPVQDGEQINIDGITVRFYHTHADTDDSLIMHFPELDLVVHNAAIMPMMFPLYTLRGDNFRHPLRLMAGIDIIRRIKPTHLVGCHGFPISDRDDAYELATINRDVAAYLYQQTVRGINAGLSPDDLVQKIELPAYFAEHPGLTQSYIDVEYIVRGIYRGLIGWWADDAAELNPPTDDEFYNVFIEECGGSEPILHRARLAFDSGKYNLTAKLMSAVLSIEPDHKDAKQLKADALRAMGHATPCGIQARNFFLTEALHLEGKINRMRLPISTPGAAPSLDMVLRTIPGTFLKMLEIVADQRKATAVFATMSIRFTDLDLSFGLSVRGGAVELSEGTPEHSSASLEFARPVWASIVLRQETLKNAIEKGRATLHIDSEQGARLIETFSKLWGEI